MTKLNELIKNNTVVVIDTETTGLHPNVDKIYEISARKMIGGEIINALFLFRNDKLKVDYSAIGINVDLFKIGNGMDAHDYSCRVVTSFDYATPLLFIAESKITLEASDIKSAVKKLKHFIGKGILCSYNLAFDFKFLNQYTTFEGIETVDLLPIIKEEIGDKVCNLQLKSVCEYFEIETDKKSDVTLTAELLRKLADDSR